jgi:hypothetical protein
MAMPGAPDSMQNRVSSPLGEWARIPGGNKPGVVWVICTEFPGSRACPQIEAKPNGVDEPGGNGILIRLLGS